jgi:hypothetical protein
VLQVRLDRFGVIESDAARISIAPVYQHKLRLTVRIENKLDDVVDIYIKLSMTSWDPYNTSVVVALSSPFALDMLQYLIGAVEF